MKFSPACSPSRRPSAGAALGATGARAPQPAGLPLVATAAWGRQRGQRGQGASPQSVAALAQGPARTETPSCCCTASHTRGCPAPAAPTQRGGEGPGATLLPGAGSPAQPVGHCGARPAPAPPPQGPRTPSSSSATEAPEPRRSQSDAKLSSSRPPRRFARINKAKRLNAEQHADAEGNARRHLLQHPRRQSQRSHFLTF